ncbi:MAG: hypothetical protein ACTSU5_15780 [Promethearchaeota archaeon]
MPLDPQQVAILAAIGVNLAIFLLTIRKFVQTKIKAILHLSGLNVFAILYEWGSFLAAAPDSGHWQDGYVRASYVFPVLMGWMFVLFLDSFSEESKYGPKTSVSAFFLGAIVTLVVQEDISYDAILLVVVTYFLLVTFWTYRVLNTSLYYVTDEEAEKQIKWMKVGLLVAFLGTAAIDTLNVLITTSFSRSQRQLPYGGFLLDTAPHVVLAIGTLLVAASYITHPRVAVVQPQNIYKLFVILESGLPVFSHEFSGEVEIDDTLLSGALNAITSLMTEAVGVNESLDQIRFGDRVLLVSIREKIAGILITDQPTTFLRDGLDNFLTRFLQEYGGEIRGWTGDPSVFKHAHEIIQRVFGLRVEHRKRPRELEII